MRKKQVFAASVLTGVVFGLVPTNPAQAAELTPVCGAGFTFEPSSNLCVKVKKETKPAAKKWVFPAPNGKRIQCNAYPYFGPGNQVDQCKNAVRQYIKLQPDSDQYADFRITPPVWSHTTWITHASLLMYQNEKGWKRQGGTLVRETRITAPPTWKEDFAAERDQIGLLVGLINSGDTSNPAKLRIAKDRAVGGFEALTHDSSRAALRSELEEALRAYHAHVTREFGERVDALTSAWHDIEKLTIALSRARSWRTELNLTDIPFDEARYVNRIAELRDAQKAPAPMDHGWLEFTVRDHTSVWAHMEGWDNTHKPQQCDAGVLASWLATCGYLVEYWSSDPSVPRGYARFAWSDVNRGTLSVVEGLLPGHKYYFKSSLVNDIYLNPVLNMLDESVGPYALESRVSSVTIPLASIGPFQDLKVSSVTATSIAVQFKAPETGPAGVMLWVNNREPQYSVTETGLADGTVIYEATITGLAKNTEYVVSVAPTAPQTENNKISSVVVTTAQS